VKFNDSLFIARNPSGDCSYEITNLHVKMAPSTGKDAFATQNRERTEAQKQESAFTCGLFLKEAASAQAQHHE